MKINKIYNEDCSCTLKEMDDNFIGFEKVTEYCKMANKRINKF